MFDISFSELLVIAIVALVVIGPEKLPKVARTAGAFFGRLQRFVTQVKDEVNRETRFAELQTLQQEVQSGLRQGYGEIEQSILPTGSQVVAHDQDRDNIPEVTSSDEAVEVAATKKTRKPRQRKIAADVGSEAIEAVQLPAEHAEQPKLSADPQAELFAVALDQKKPRRTRSHTTKKKDDATAESEQKPLA